MTSQNLIVKTSKVTLTGNLMTGNTYPVKQWIKEYLCGKWDASRNGWVVDLGQVEKFMNSQYPAIKVDTSASTEKSNGMRYPRTSAELTREMDREDSDY